jgi:hypothetical protein
MREKLKIGLHVDHVLEPFVGGIRVELDPLRHDALGVHVGGPDQERVVLLTLSVKKFNGEAIRIGVKHATIVPRKILRDLVVALALSRQRHGSSTQFERSKCVPARFLRVCPFRSVKTGESEGVGSQGIHRLDGLHDSRRFVAPLQVGLDAGRDEGDAATHREVKSPATQPEGWVWLCSSGFVFVACRAALSRAIVAAAK